MATGIIATMTTLSQKPIALKLKPTLFPAKTTASSSTASINCVVGVAGLLGSSLAITLVGPASASVLPSLSQLSEASNALSLPTWAIHVSSVVEWITAMALVWQYGERSGFESWKGLSWGMVPLLGGAFCACTWHFFYNAESLECAILHLLESEIATSLDWSGVGGSSSSFDGIGKCYHVHCCFPHL